MSASAPGTILREIHRLRRNLKNLQTEIERIPRLLKGQQAKVERTEEESKQAHDQLKHLKVSIKDKEVELKATQQLAIKHEQQMNGASSKKEYDAFKIEIANDKRRCQELEDEILNGMMEVDERAAKLPTFDQAVAAAKKEFADYERDSHGRLKGLHEQVAQTQQQLKEVEASLPIDTRAVYERQVAARGEDAMSAVEGRTCKECYTEITAQQSNDLIRGMFLTCKSCGRMLYLAEST